MQWEYKAVTMRAGGFLGGKVDQSDLYRCLTRAKGRVRHAT
jgi:hypothetical protein